MIVVVGLGNPGLRYAKTRHNVGFMVIDRLVRQTGIRLKDNKKKAMVGVCTIEGQKVALVKPLTFMNCSGNGVSEIMSFYRADPENELIVICDDVSLSPGMIRIRKKGSAGGHNGLKNIIAHLGTEEFPRIRIGVGEKTEGWDLADYVLARFDKDTEPVMREALKNAVLAVETWIAEGIDAAMNKYNTPSEKKQKEKKENKENKENKEIKETE